MAHFAFVAHGLTSPLNASLELSRRLVEAGHRVSYVSHADVGAEVEAAGFSFVRLTEAWVPSRDLSADLRRRPIASLVAMRRTRARTINSDEIERVVTTLDPDMLLIDIEMHYTVIATAKLGIPTMLVMNWLSIFKLPDLPPLNTQLMPGDEAAIERAWRQVEVDAVKARMRHKLSKRGLGDLLRPVSFGTRYYADLKRVAKARSYSLAENTDRRQWLRPYTYTRLPVLCFNAVEFEFPHNPHPNLEYVGPMVNRARTERRLDPGDAEAWREFKRRRADSEQQRPLIYCSLGSYWSDPSFLRMVLATFERHDEWDLVLGLGGQTSAAELGRVPPNVLLLDYAPQLDVLAEASCSINHGGITSINECISFEVPMVVYSPSLLDQDGCAARVEYHGLGVSAAWETSNPESLGRHIEHVLNDDQIQANVRTMRQAFDRYEEEDVAVSVIEDHLRAAADRPDPRRAL